MLITFQQKLGSRNKGSKLLPLGASEASWGVKEQRTSPVLGFPLWFHPRNASSTGKLTCRHNMWAASKGSEGTPEVPQRCPSGRWDRIPRGASTMGSSRDGTQRIRQVRPPTLAHAAQPRNRLIGCVCVWVRGGYGCTERGLLYAGSHGNPTVCICKLGTLESQWWTKPQRPRTRALLSQGRRSCQKRSCLLPPSCSSQVPDGLGTG